MSDDGGQITQRAVSYQNKIAALYLGRMLDPRAARLPLAWLAPAGRILEASAALLFLFAVWRRVKPFLV
jgi:hypothetical protein